MLVPVYDIVNCGPRHRFVANGKIVHNSDRVNLQNLPSRGDTSLKNCIRAPQGHTIVGADLSNIELRVGLWFADQQNSLDIIAEGLDLYKVFATQVFGVDYNDVNDNQRFIAKTSQLSLIYGVGAAKLRNAIQVASGKDIGQDEAERIVRLYRTQHAKVKQMWDIGEICLQSINSDERHAYGRNDVVSICGTDGCRLPVGLYMRYPELQRITEDSRTQWVYNTRRGREYIYGAKFYQGLVQALARCIMGEQMLHIAKKYHIALTIHDAVYLVVPDNEVDQAVAFLKDKMSIAPAWIPGIPLKADAHYGQTLADAG